MDQAIKPYLQRIKLNRENIENPDQYPFSIPALKDFDSLEFHPDVTFIIGENGIGKSTIIEAIALEMGFSPEGGTKNVNQETVETTSDLYEHISLVKRHHRPHESYFFRAESFFNISTYMDAMEPSPFADSNNPHGYGPSYLHQQSHGEAFLAVINNKFQGGGLYILDEPEAALSPNRQISVLSRIHELVDNYSQFIIATHSPILLSYPRAKIIQLSSSGIKEVTYEETEHYQVTKQFLNNHTTILEELIIKKTQTKQPQKRSQEYLDFLNE